MKKITGKLAVFTAVILTMLAVSLVGANAVEPSEVPYTFAYLASEEEAGAFVTFELGRDGRTYLFLPSSADYSSMTFSFDEELYSKIVLTNEKGSVELVSNSPVDISALITADEDEQIVTLDAVYTDLSDSQDEIVLMKSASLRTLYFVSDDPENAGRAFVDTSKSNSASGNAVLLTADGSVDFSGTITEIKGRGNTTFEKFDKKPYQIKLDKKKELVDGAGKNKKWVLLANAADPTLIRNSLTFAAGDLLGLPNTCKFETIDFYYDGEYRGTYLLTEKVEVGDGRIEISETDDLIEDANKDTPAYEDPVTETVSRLDVSQPVAADAPGSVRYVKDLTEPEFPEGASHHAFLLEFEFANRYPDELTGFITDRAQCMVTKTPEYLTLEQGKYIANYWQEFEDAVYSPDGYNAETGKYYYDYCDLDSLAKCYLLNEMVKNCDYYGSSTFFYLAEDADQFICGPLWDYDLAYGIGYDTNRSSIVTKPEFFYCAGQPFGGALLRIQSFRDKMQELLAPDGEMTAAIQAMLGDEGTIVKYSEEVMQSQKMNYKLWDISNRDMPAVSQPLGLTYEQAVANLQNFMQTRFDWLSAEINAWDGENYIIRTDTDENMMKSIYGRFMKIVQQMMELVNLLMRMLQVLACAA